MKKSLLILSALTFSLGVALTPIKVGASLPLQVNGQQLPSLAPMLEQVTPAVVSISVEGKQVSRQRIPDAFRYFFGDDFPNNKAQERPFRGLGSGVIINAKERYVVTNYHVINSADKISVQLNDGREFEAELIGGDQMSDIALLRLEKKAKQLAEITLADSDQLRVGDFTVAVGNPFGLGQTVTSGIVSALGRSGLNIENFESYIQTDAAINSGNSGGALVNLNGELIGINTAIIAPNGGNVGIGFAIPSNMMKSLTEQIIEFGEVKRGVLGIRGGEVTSELAETFGVDSSKGAFVSEVLPDGAADKAGLQAGDIITSINDKNINTFSELRAKIATLGSGKKVKLGVIRDGKQRSFDVTLQEATEAKAKAESLHESLTGAELSNTTAEDTIEGIKVIKVADSSPAKASGLNEGDIIIGINRQRVRNLGQLRKVIDEKPSVVALNIIRDNREIYIVIR